MFKNSPFLYYLSYLATLQPALTQTTSAESKSLSYYAKDKKCLVEIGVWHGVNTRNIRSVMNPQGVIYAIDPFEPNGKFGRSWQKPIAHAEANKSRNGSLVWLEDYSYRAIEKFQELNPQETPIDFIFIDGDHSYEGLKTDWEQWSPLVASNGIVALHDSRSYADRSIEHIGSVQFTEQFIMGASHLGISINTH